MTTSSARAEISFDPCGRGYKAASAFVAGDVHKVAVEAGFLFDGASAPRFTLNILGLSRFDPRLILAACVHDKAYRSGCISRKEADVLFYNLLVQGGVTKNKACILYQSVRKFGWLHYNKSNKP